MLSFLQGNRLEVKFFPHSWYEQLNQQDMFIEMCARNMQNGDNVERNAGGKEP